MSTICKNIQYIFELEDRKAAFDVSIDDFEVELGEASMPEWMRLDYEQCQICTQKSSDCLVCTMAVRIQTVIDTFGKDVSTEKVRVQVRTPQREFEQHCDLQTGIHSLLGLLMATSGCLYLETMRALVNFHIPFCSTEEMLRRIVGAYLTKQYFVLRDGGKPDWDLKGLEAVFHNLSIVNKDFVRRLKGAVEKDAVTNAIHAYFATSSLFAADLKSQIERQRGYLLNERELV
jgi:hypothetical protein